MKSRVRRKEGIIAVEESTGVEAEEDMRGGGTEKQEGEEERRRAESNDSLEDQDFCNYCLELPIRITLTK